MIYEQTSKMQCLIDLRVQLRMLSDASLVGLAQNCRERNTLLQPSRAMVGWADEVYH